MRARDQSSIFSTGGKFRPDYLLELHALTLVARSYVLLWAVIHTESDLMLVQCLVGNA